jgi:hypothetical protein
MLADSKSTSSEVAHATCHGIHASITKISVLIDPENAVNEQE